MLKDSEVYEQHIKWILNSLSMEELERLSADSIPENVTVKEAKAMVDLTFELGKIDSGKIKFSEKELIKYTGQAYVWVCFELFIRLGTSEFDKKTGNLKHTKKGRLCLKILKPVM